MPDRVAGIFRAIDTQPFRPMIHGRDDMLRYLCAATHLDDDFANNAIRELLVEPTRARRGLTSLEQQVDGSAAGNVISRSEHIVGDAATQVTVAKVVTR